MQRNKHPTSNDISEAHEAFYKAILKDISEVQREFYKSTMVLQYQHGALLKGK